MISSGHFSTIPATCNLVPWLWRWVIQQFSGDFRTSTRARCSKTHRRLSGRNVRYTFQNEESTNGQKLPFQLSKSHLPTRIFMRYVSQLLPDRSGGRGWSIRCGNSTMVTGAKRWLWFGMGKSDSDVFSDQQKRFFFMMVVWGSLHFGIWEIFSEGITLHLDSPVNLCDFFHLFLFSLHITEVEQLYIALHDLGHVQKEEGWRQAAKSCKKSRCVVRFLCGRGCKKTPHAEIGNWYTPTVYQELEIHSHAFYRSGLFKIIGSARIFNMRSVWMEGQPILGIRNIKFVMFSWVEAMDTT